MKAGRPKTRAWRCVPRPLSGWEKSLGWILASMTLFEASIAAKVFHLPHPILIGVLVASSVPAIFPLRSLRRAPRVRLADGKLLFWAPWATRPKPDMPTVVECADVDLANAGLVDLGRRPDLQLTTGASSAGARVGAIGAASAAKGGAIAEGWRRLANGKQAHVSIHPGLPAVYLPTRDGYAFLLAIHRPEGLLDGIRSELSSPR